METTSTERENARSRALAVVRNPLNTPQGVAEAAIERACLREFTAAAASAARDRAVEKFAEDIERDLQTWNFDGVAAKATTLVYTLNRIVDAEPAPAVGAAAVAARRREFEEAGWTSFEVDLAAQQISPDARVVGFDGLGINTDKGRMIRSAIREAGRPSSWSRRDTWLAQFPPLGAAESGKTVGEVR